MTWLTLFIEYTKSEFHLEIPSKRIERNFSSKGALAEYIATRFTMPMDEANIYVEKADERPVTLALPVIPENLHKL